MTPALKAMVEAMAAERDRQVVDEGVDMADELDLEKVARAGLEALRDPGEQAHMAGLKDRNEFGSVCNTWEAMVDAILKDTP